MPVPVSAGWEYTISRESCQNACTAASTGDVLVFGRFFLASGKSDAEAGVDAAEELSGTGCECHEV